MSRTKRIYNRINLFPNPILTKDGQFIPIDSKATYRQLCMGNCRTCKKWKIKEHRKRIQYQNEYITEQIQDVKLT